jgi:hypothetical protein
MHKEFFMHVSTLFSLAMFLVLVLATQMKIRHMTKKLDYLLGKKPVPYAYRPTIE